MAEKVDDDVRDEIIQRLLKEPENKVSTSLNFIYSFLLLNFRHVSTVAARIQNGVVPILPFSFVSNALAPTEVMELISVLSDHSRWTSGRKPNSNKWSLEATQEPKSITKRTE